MAAQARAAMHSTSTSWRPQLAGFLRQQSDSARAGTTGGSCLEDEFRQEVEDAFREALQAAASRAEANEAFVQDLTLAIDRIIEKHRLADSEEAQTAVEGIGRFLEFANTAHSRPNESSIKQLVCAEEPMYLKFTLCASSFHPLDLMHGTAATGSSNMHATPWIRSVLYLQVVASQVCSPAIQTAAELLVRRGAVPVKAGAEVKSRLDVLKQALDEVLSTV